MPFYTKGDVRIRYEEAGSGFPLFLVPGGGLNSRISNWTNAVFNSMAIFQDGKPVFHMHRSEIESRDAFAIAASLKQAFQAHCATRQ